MLTLLQNVLVAVVDPISIKIADFGVSKRTKGTMLHTHLGSQRYSAPELMGLLPRRYMRKNYSNAVDMWALGCVVHELLTGQILFREIEYEADGTTEFDFGSVEYMIPQTDIYGVKAFCDGKTEFPTDVLRRAGVSEVAIEFLNATFVADPESRAGAKEALGSAWLEDEKGGIDINHEDLEITVIEQSSGVGTSEPDLQSEM